MVKRSIHVAVNDAGLEAGVRVAKEMEEAMTM
jgi:hypothetical protein